MDIDTEQLFDDPIDEEDAVERLSETEALLLGLDARSPRQATEAEPFPTVER